MFNIRQYDDNKDFKEIKRWVSHHGFSILCLNNFPKNSTFIVEENNKPVAIASIYLSICGNLAFLDNGFGNPDFKGPVRTEAFKTLINFLENYSKALGYKNLMFNTKIEKLKDKYQSWGYKSENMFVFIKDLSKGDK